ncbi:MAG: Spy/CpxP family protein refolding chaperone [bacterium]
MKSKGKNLVWLFIIIAFSLSPLPVYAQPQSNNPGRNEADLKSREELLLKINEQLHLSPEQAEQLQILQRKHREKAKQYHGIIKAKKEELKRELQKQELNMEKVHQLHSELKGMIEEREDDRLHEILRVREILTPEQLVRFLELKERFRHRSKLKSRNRQR